jgi:hypothetical protein
MNSESVYSKQEKSQRREVEIKLDKEKQTEYEHGEINSHTFITVST